jgi:putative membrane protein
MRNFILRALIAAAGLWLASYLVPGIHFRDWTILLIAAVVLGLVNAFVRPVVTILTLPLTLVTLGLFLLVVNAAMIGLTAYVLHGFTVDGFWPAVLAAVVTGLVSWVGDRLLREGRA